jgi:hypothetical protein
MSGPFDAAARTCFLAGVLAGAKVEIVMRGRGTEGQATVEIDRYDGTGGIYVYVADSGKWTAYRAGIGPIGGGRVFTATGIFSPARSLG